MKYWRKPLDVDRVRIPRGEVRIIAERCKGCGFCIEYCPRDVLVESAAFNRKGYHPPEVARRNECVNCNLCEMICPDFAIFSVLVDGTAGAGTSARPAQAEAVPSGTPAPPARALSAEAGVCAPMVPAEAAMACARRAQEGVA